MRRFSQRNQLVTLNDINITPLLDLAFVLLIIFVITTPVLTEQRSLQLSLPTGGAASSPVRKDEVRTIEVSMQGGYVLKGKTYSLETLQGVLAQEFKADPNLAIWVRADKAGKYEDVFNLLELCRKLNIKKIDFAAVPQKKK